MIRRLELPLLALIVLGAAWLRLGPHLAQPLWLDEAYTAYAAGKGWAFLWRVVPTYEVHPPFYYTLVRLWTLAFGESLIALRASSIAAGIAAVPAMWAAGRALARQSGLDAARLGLVAASLAALAPMIVAMTREVRPYPVMILVYALAILCLLRAAAGVAATGRLPRGPWGGYVAALATMLWLHNLGPLYGAALGLAALLLIARAGLPRGTWLRFFGGHLAAGLLWLPALLILIDQAPTWVSSTWLRFRWAGLEWRLALLALAPSGIALVALAVLAALAAWGLRSGEARRALVALVVLAVLPVTVSILLSALVAPVFIPRTMTALGVPVALLAAAGVAAARGRIAQALAGGAALILAWQMLTWDLALRRAGPPQDWYAALRWLQPRFRAGDVVLAYPNEGALPFDYAVRDLKLAMPSRAIPTAVPSLNLGGWNPTGSRGVVSLPKARLERIADAPETRAVPTVWLLRLGPWAYDKGDLFLHALERDRTIVGRYADGPIDIVGLRLNPGPAAPAAAAAAR